MFEYLSGAEVKIYRYVMEEWKLYKTLITDEYGHAETIVPAGKYRIVIGREDKTYIEKHIEATTDTVIIVNLPYGVLAVQIDLYHRYSTPPYTTDIKPLKPIDLHDPFTRIKYTPLPDAEINIEHRYSVPPYTTRIVSLKPFERHESFHYATISVDGDLYIELTNKG